MSTIGDRMLIIQCDAAQLPSLYSEVTDRRMKPVGKILDLFGNVKAWISSGMSKHPTQQSSAGKNVRSSRMKNSSQNDCIIPGYPGSHVRKK